MEAEYQQIGTLDTETGEQTLQSIARLRSPEYFMEAQEFQQEIPINVVPSTVPAPQPMLQDGGQIESPILPPQNATPVTYPSPVTSGTRSPSQGRARIYGPLTNRQAPYSPSAPTPTDQTDDMCRLLVHQLRSELQEQEADFVRRRNQMESFIARGLSQVSQYTASIKAQSEQAVTSTAQEARARFGEIQSEAEEARNACETMIHQAQAVQEQDRQIIGQEAMAFAEAQRLREKEIVAEAQVAVKEATRRLTEAQFLESQLQEEMQRLRLESAQAAAKAPHIQPKWPSPIHAPSQAPSVTLGRPQCLANQPQYFDIWSQQGLTPTISNATSSATTPPRPTQYNPPGPAPIPQGYAEPKYGSMPPFAGHAQCGGPATAPYMNDPRNMFCQNMPPPEAQPLFNNQKRKEADRILIPKLPSYTQFKAWKFKSTGQRRSRFG